MSHKGAVEAVDRTMKEFIKKPNITMGSVTVIFAGDFRQTLPVIPRGTKAEHLMSCLKSLYLWGKMKHLTLTINMRANITPFIDATNFSDRLLKIGNGDVIGNDLHGILTISNIGKHCKSERELITPVFPDLQTRYKDTRLVIRKSHTSTQE